MDTRASLLLAEKRQSFRGDRGDGDRDYGGRAVPSGSHRTSAAVGAPHLVPLNVTELQQRDDYRSRSRSQPNSLPFRGEVGPGQLNASHTRSHPGSPPTHSASLDPSHPSFPKSYSFPSHRHPSSSHPLPQNLEQLPPSHSSNLPPSSAHPYQAPYPTQHTADQSSSQPSFHSDDDDVFNTSASHPPTAGRRPRERPPLPRHSSMVPSRTTYLTDSEPDPRWSQLNPPMFGVEDISSVLDRSTEQTPQGRPVPSQHQTHSNLHSSLSPPSHPSSRQISHMSASIIPHNYQPPLHRSGWHDSHSAGMTAAPPPKHHSPSDNESSASSGRPLGYTRDHLQGAIQKLRQGHFPRHPAHMNNVSSYSDPVARSRTDLYDPDFTSHPVSSSHPHIPLAQDYHPVLNQRPYESSYYSGPLSRQKEDQRRPRAYSEGSHRLPQLPPDAIDHRGEFGLSDRHHPQRPYLPASHPTPTLSSSNRSYTSHRLPLKNDSVPHSTHPSSSHPSGRNPSSYPPPTYPRHMDSTSSGIGSRNTSQSTGSFHPSRRGSAGKGSTSFSSGVDPDVSLDTTGGGGNGVGSHRRDTSTDENYEFDSINALESDIIADLRRYSRLSNNRDSLPPSQSDRSSQMAPSDSLDPVVYPYQKPSRPSQYPDSERRFERLREEFKQYRQQQQQQQQQYSPYQQSSFVGQSVLPMGPSVNLPLGSSGEPLYPMDSDML